MHFAFPRLRVGLLAVLLAGRLAVPLAVAASSRADAVFVEPTGTIELRDALGAALLGNPELHAFSEEVRAREARALQEGRFPNPALDVESENVGATRGAAFARTETTLSLAQLVELGGKRAKRVRVAELERDLASWDYEARRVSVLAAVTKAFVAALAAQERLALADELITIATRSVGSVSGQVRAGAVSPVETDRARVALDRTRLERIELEHELQAARSDLAASWGSTRVSFTALRGDLTAIAEPPPLAQLLARVDANPDLARWTSEVAQRRAALDVERTRAIPDLTARAGLRHLNEDDAATAVLELSLPLPVFDRNQGGIAAAHHRVLKAEAEHALADATIRAALTRAYENLHAAFDQVITLRDEVIPRAQNVFRRIQEDYAGGLFRYLEVLDAQRTLFELRDQYLQSLASYHGARAEVERLTGPTAPQHSPAKEKP